jgi:hypothetical protein
LPYPGPLRPRRAAPSAWRISWTRRPRSTNRSRSMASIASTAVVPARLAAALSGAVLRSAHCTKATSRTPVRSRKSAVGCLMTPPLSERLDLPISVSRRARQSLVDTQGSRQGFRIRARRGAATDLPPASRARWSANMTPTALLSKQVRSAHGGYARAWRRAGPSLIVIQSQAWQLRIRDRSETWPRGGCRAAGKCRRWRVAGWAAGMDAG